MDAPQADCRVSEASLSECLLGHSCVQMTPLQDSWFARVRETLDEDTRPNEVSQAWLTAFCSSDFTSLDQWLPATRLGTTACGCVFGWHLAAQSASWEGQKGRRYPQGDAFGQAARSLLRLNASLSCGLSPARTSWWLDAAAEELPVKVFKAWLAKLRAAPAHQHNTQRQRDALFACAPATCSIGSVRDLGNGAASRNQDVDEFT